MGQQVEGESILLLRAQDVFRSQPGPEGETCNSGVMKKYKITKSNFSMAANNPALLANM
jgi:hypothetical protein